MSDEEKEKQVDVLISFLRFVVATFPELETILYNAVKGWSQSAGHGEDVVLDKLWPPSPGPEEVDAEMDKKIESAGFRKASTVPPPVRMSVLPKKLSEHPEILDPNSDSRK